MALTREKQILIAAVVLAGLGAAVYFQQKKDARVGVETLSSAQLPSISGPEDVDKIDITNGEKGEVVLEKKEDKWWLTKPANALANQTNVKQLLDNLKELKATEIVAANATDDLKKSYDLDAAKAVHVLGFKAGDKKVDDYFGKSGSHGRRQQCRLLGELILGLHVQPRRKGVARYGDPQVRRRDRQYRRDREYARSDLVHEGE